MFECWQHGRAGPAADIPLDYPTSSHTVSYSFSSDTDSVIGLFFKQFKDFKKVIKGQPHEGGGEELRRIQQIEQMFPCSNAATIFFYSGPKGCRIYSEIK